MLSIERHAVLSKLLSILPLASLIGLINIYSSLLPFFTDTLPTEHSEFAYKLLGFLCHQHPSRSFSFFGKTMWLCARCSSFYFSFMIYTLIFPFYPIYLSRRNFIISIIPLLLDGCSQFFSLRESTNLIRFLTGTLAGFTASMRLTPFCAFYTEMLWRTTRHEELAN